MPQFIVGLFTSYRDGHEALRALQALGLARDHGFLYMATKGSEGAKFIADAPVADRHLQECAEYAVHGEHMGVAGVGNQYCSEPGFSWPTASSTAASNIDSPTRTLLVVEELPRMQSAATCEVLYNFGAVAVKDAVGHWHVSPYRRGCCRKG